MQKQELYNKIRTRINELVPHLKELSFGCVGKYGNNTYPATYINRLNKDNIQVICHTLGNIKILENDWFEIIGHPIHLEHILEAIKENKNFFAYVDDYGDVCIESKIAHFLADYNLSLPLSDQSEETLKALLELLK